MFLLLGSQVFRATVPMRRSPELVVACWLDPYDEAAVLLCVNGAGSVFDTARVAALQFLIA